MYDQHDHLIRFDITEVLYVPDFITNIVSMRLAKQQANLFFETQFGCVYDANEYIHATTQELCNQWVLKYAEPATLNKAALATIQQSPNAGFKSTSHFKILTLPLHDASTLENWRCRFGFVSEKVI